MSDSSTLKIIISNRTVVADGEEFGNTGCYERLDGMVSFAIDPEQPAFSHITDLQYAQRNTDGRVEFTSDLCILKPVDLALGNRRLLYDVINRGNKRALLDFSEAPEGEGNRAGNDPVSAVDMGNGFLLRQGYTIAWSAWQGDILPGDQRMTIKLPSALGISGQVRTELITEETGIHYLPLSGNPCTRSYKTVSLETDKATLTCREHETDERIPVSSDDWQFACCDDEGKLIPSDSHCYINNGFKPGWLYELIYTACDPIIMGLGFIGVQQLISFLMHEERDCAGIVNPLHEKGIRLEKAYGYGISQSARFLREFVYRGYNQDMAGHRVFDGILAHVSGAGRVTLNYRFAQPGRFPRQHSDHLYPSDQFPFAYHVINDPLTAITDGILKRPETDPLVIHTQTSAEYWERRGSLVHTDPDGNDLPGHERARVYLFASAPHVPCPDRSLVAEPQAYAKNRLNTSPLLRALLVALDNWVAKDTHPHPDCVPKLTDATAVTSQTAAQLFPAIPGIRFPESHNRLHVQDFGQNYENGIFDREPPGEDREQEYTVLVPATDADGQDISGIRTPDVAVPLATYTGWNMRKEGNAGQEQSGVLGAQFPFPQTEEIRKDNYDPRISIQARYKDRSIYLQHVINVVQELLEQRLLLEDDGRNYIAVAGKIKLPDENTDIQ